MNKHAPRTSVHTKSERSLEVSGAGASSGIPRWSGNCELLSDVSDMRDDRDVRDSTAELRVGSTCVVRKHFTAWSLRSL